MSNIKGITNHDEMLRSLNELREELSKKNFLLYLLMHTLSEKEDITLAGFYKEDESIVKTATFSKDTWILNEENDQIISEEKPSEIQLSKSLSINEIIKIISNSDEDFERYTKIIASLSINKDLNAPVWNILAFLDNNKVNNIKVNASSGKVIKSENLDLVRRI